MTCSVCTYEWCWICSADHFDFHCQKKAPVPDLNARPPSKWVLIKPFVILAILYPIFCATIPMILFAGLVVFMIVAAHILFYDEFEGDLCEKYSLGLYALGLSYLLLACSLAIGLFVYVIFLAIIFGGPTLCYLGYLILWNESEYRWQMDDYNRRYNPLVTS